MEWTSAELRRLRDDIKRANRRIVNAVVGTGLLLGAAVLYGLSGHAPEIFLGAPVLSWIFACLGLVVLVLNWPDKRER